MAAVIISGILIILYICIGRKCLFYVQDHKEDDSDFTR